METDTILITGALGQIGSELAEKLKTIHGKNNVIISDIRDPKDVDYDGIYEVIDVMDVDRIKEVIAKHNIKTVYHLAALLSGTAEKNPMFGWKYARKEAPKSVDDVDPFTADEQAVILSACDEPQHRNLIQFAFWSGMRTSELAALEWGDIDWRRGIVRVSRAKTQASDEPEGTKTRRGTRDVKLLDPARAALEAQKQYSYLAGKEVFLNPRTMYAWEGDQPIRNSAWIPALKKAEVRYRRQYQTRHTFASMMLTAGESPVWLAQQMGHSDLTMISRTYGRWITDAAPEAGNRAVEMFGGNAAVKLPNQGNSMPKTRQRAE